MCAKNENCQSLTSIEIPNSVTSIGGYAFSGCHKLDSINIPNSVTSIRSYAFAESGLYSVTLGNSVKSIGDYAFCWCQVLTSVTIGNSVTSIGPSAFLHCDRLTSATIGNSVESIGDDAFYGCKNLQTLTVYMDNPVPLRDSDTFGQVKKSTCVLYVPKGSLEAYKAAPVWKDFLNIVEMSEEETGAKSTLADSGIRVFGKGMNIIVKGAPESAPVKVSGTNGFTLRNTTGNGTITMDTKGIYFVTVGDQTFKVWL